MSNRPTRRTFVAGTASLLGLVLAGCSAPGGDGEEGEEGEGGENGGGGEDDEDEVAGDGIDRPDDGD